MGTEPIEEEIPVEIDDFPDDVQETLSIYFRLKDEWDTFNGNYLGKNMTNVRDIFELFDIPKEDHRTVYDLLTMIDLHRSNYIKKVSDQKTAKTPR